MVRGSSPEYYRREGGEERQKMMRVGCRVQVKGLVKAFDCNGKEGLVVGSQGERYKVKLAEDERTLVVKESNLEEVSEEEEVCPLCLEALTPAASDFMSSKNVRFACCGKSICSRCQSEAEGRVSCCPLCRETITTDEENIAWIQRHAAKGRAWACSNLAVRYRDGDGVEKDDEKAFFIFEEAAHQGYVPACHELGACYYLGRGVERNYALALEWYGRGVKAGFALSQYHLARAYFDGLGVEKNIAEGVRLFRLSADQGFFEAQHILADCYWEGIGPIKQNLETAITWYLKAAKQQSPRALHSLCVSLNRLHNHTLPPPAAVYCLRKAASFKFAPSLQELPSIERLIDHRCANCQVTKPKRRCARCRAVKYCSAACQKSHWRNGGHGRLCTDKDMHITDLQINFHDYRH